MPEQLWAEAEPDAHRARSAKAAMRRNLILPTFPVAAHSIKLKKRPKLSVLAGTHAFIGADRNHANAMILLFIQVDSGSWRKITIRRGCGASPVRLS
jgi:hypothetical protein